MLGASARLRPDSRMLAVSTLMTWRA